MHKQGWTGWQPVPLAPRSLVPAHHLQSRAGQPPNAAPADQPYYAGGGSPNRYQQHQPYPHQPTSPSRWPTSADPAAHHSPHSPHAAAAAAYAAAAAAYHPAHYGAPTHVPHYGAAPPPPTHVPLAPQPAYEPPPGYSLVPTHALHASPTRAGNHGGGPLPGAATAAHWGRVTGAIAAANTSYASYQGAATAGADGAAPLRPGQPQQSAEHLRAHAAVNILAKNPHPHPHPHLSPFTLTPTRTRCPLRAQAVATSGASRRPGVALGRLRGMLRARSRVRSLPPLEP